MSPISHFLLSWVVAEAIGRDTAERRIITLVGIAPDLDGLGVMVDVVSPWVGGPITAFYSEYHHALLHGLFGATLLSMCAAAAVRRRALVGVGAFLVVHLHLLCDLVGSRGPSPRDPWSISYFAPFSNLATLQWQAQWPLNAWPNIVITVLLIALGFVWAVRFGRSPLAAISQTADQLFVETVQGRWRQFRMRGQF